MELQDKNINFTHYLETWYPKVISHINEYAVFMIDTKGVVRTWNEGCLNLTGFPPEEIIGKHLELLYPRFLREKQLPEKHIEEAQFIGKLETEDWLVRQNGSLFCAHILILRLEDEEGKIVGFSKIIKDLTFRKKLEGELKSLNQQLQESNADMDNFIYTASHDLKGPINNIEGLIRSLYDELDYQDKFAPGVRQIMELIAISVDQLRETINDMALSAKIEANFPLETSNVSFKEVTEEAISLLKKQINETEAVIEYDFSGAKYIPFSKKNLRSVLMNLIANSIKFRSHERKPHIKIETYRTEEGVVLEVNDNGLGIPVHEKDRVFKMYEKLHDHAEGSGFAMAIVAKIIDGSKGRIEIESKEGSGSTFKIYFGK